MMEYMSNKTAIVTGGSRGIGRGISIELAKRGMNLVINYASNEKAAEETRDICKSFGIDVELVKGDMSKESDCESLCQKALETFGSIDVLVNNAGITRDGLAMRMSSEDFDKVVKTNLYGPFYMMRQVSRTMMKQRYGRVINISSVTGLVGNPGQINYAAAKAGLIGMTKTFAKEMAAKGVTVNAVAPGFVDTDMTTAIQEANSDGIKSSIPMKSIGVPEDIAAVVGFLASEEAGYVTGEVIRSDGGLAI